MQIPQSHILTTRYLNRVFDKTVATYKYYWLLGILDLFVKQGKTRMNVWEIMVTMVANAWYPVNYFRLSFGKNACQSFRVRVIFLLASRLLLSTTFMYL